MPITAGSISIGRRINTGDYSHKEAKVELHYVAENGEKIGDLGDMARVEALTQLSAILSTVVTIEHTPEIVVDGGVAATIEPKQEPAKRRGRPPKQPESKWPGVTEPIPEASPADPTLPAVSVETPTLPQTDAKSAEVVPTGEISDKELNNACNETMNRIKNKVAIQETIARFTNGGVSTIPQDLRAPFLGQLKAL